MWKTCQEPNELGKPTQQIRLINYNGAEISTMYLLIIHTLKFPTELQFRII